MVNKVILIGRLTASPEVRYTQDGSMVTNYTIACTEKYKDRETTEFVRCVSFGKLAEICGNYLRKGSMTYVEGRLQTRSWEKDGIKRYTTEVVISNMKMLSGKTSGENVGETQDDDSVPF